MSGLGGAIFPLLVGTITVVCGGLMVRRRLPPNLIFGIKTPRTLKSDEAWYSVHAIAGPWFVLAGLAVLVTLGVEIVTELRVTVAGLLLFLVLVLIGAVLGLRRSPAK